MMISLNVNCFVKTAADSILLKANIAHGQMIYNVNQLTGFYMMGTLPLNASIPPSWNQSDNLQYKLIHLFLYGKNTGIKPEASVQNQQYK